MYNYCPDCPSCVKSSSGRCVGSQLTNGYWLVQGTRTSFYAHRLAWEAVYGPIPDGMVIDHKDRDKSNNKIENLRLVTRSQNSYNKPKVPLKLVQQLPSGKWRGRNYNSGKTEWTKAYESREKAENMALARRLELYWVI